MRSSKISTVFQGAPVYEGPEALRWQFWVKELDFWCKIWFSYAMLWAPTLAHRAMWAPTAVHKKTQGLRFFWPKTGLDSIESAWDHQKSVQFFKAHLSMRVLNSWSSPVAILGENLDSLVQNLVFLCNAVGPHIGPRGSIELYRAL